jgi:hypothetical protein
MSGRTKGTYAALAAVQEMSVRQDIVTMVYVTVAAHADWIVRMLDGRIVDHGQDMTGVPATERVVPVLPALSEEERWQTNRCCRLGRDTTAARRTPPTSAAG